MAKGQRTAVKTAGHCPSFFHMLEQSALCEWILCRVFRGSRLIITDLIHLYTDILVNLIDCLAEMSKRNCAMVRIVLFNQHMTVEASHLRNRKYTNRTEGLRCYRKYFTLCDIAAQLAVRSALQTVECDVARSDIALERAVCHFHRKASSHNLLVLHAARCKFSRAGIAAVEAHKCILVCVREFALDGLPVHISRNGIVNVEQCNSILAYAGTDILAQAAININLAGYRDSHAG